MWLKWFPWRWVLSRTARAHGFIDPVRVLSRLSRFAQPAEVTEPIELLRAAVVFHARGLINARAIQHNLDWVWPFWVERQFDPHDPAFVPRAFSITHINLTHRNWTAVGQPGCDWMPIVDPAGLVTPFYDGWSLDAWVIPSEGEALFPSRASGLGQHLVTDQTLAVRSEAGTGALGLDQRTEMVWVDRGPHCEVQLRGNTTAGGWLAVGLRPYNPEGISFIQDIEHEGEHTLRVDGQSRVRFDRPPRALAMSNYAHGDVSQQLDAIASDGRPARDEPAIQPGQASDAIHCPVGLATAAALFPIEPGETTDVTIRVPLRDGPRREPGVRQLRHRGGASPLPWPKALEDTCSATLPDGHMQSLFDAAVRSLALHCPDSVYPGPYTYRRFWFRDSTFILEALLTLNHFGQVRGAIEAFPSQQTKLGYFRSQQGEWDANGAVLWLFNRYRRLSGMPLSQSLVEAMQRGARWLWRKRLRDDLESPHAGLLPAGFSAEHLGPIDFYFWDDFWAVAGLEGAAELFTEREQHDWARPCREHANRYRQAIDRAISRTAAAQHGQGMPASPHRRMDAGAIGSIVAGHPLHLYAPDDPRLLQTTNWLLEHCTVHGGFFQDMIHSGINPYLTLHLAQVLLRAGDARWTGLMRTVAGLASPTGQWPEAVHPSTEGGCMGDGQHIWAAAEWVMMVRSCFARKEGDRLVLGSGLSGEWLERGEPMRFGPTATPFGPITVSLSPEGEHWRLDWQAEWRAPPEAIEVRLPDYPAQTCDADQRTMHVCGGGRE